MNNIIKKLYEYLGYKYQGIMFKIEDRPIYHELRIYVTYKSFSKLFNIDYYAFSIKSVYDICLMLEKDIDCYLVECFMQEIKDTYKRK